MLSLKDLLLTPIFLSIFYAIAYNLRNKLSNKQIRKYFIPALTLKFVGAIALGLVYEYYYQGGDTTNYFNQSQIIHQAFFDDPSKGIQLLFANGEFNTNILEYTSKLYWYTSPSEYLVIKIATFFGLFCGHTYIIIALFFAIFSFIGLWAFYITFLKLYPHLSKQFAIAIFFLPSVFFWGSGLMKDSLTLGALGMLFWSFYANFIDKKITIYSIVAGCIALWLLSTIKIYILLSFLPPALFWIFNENHKRIKNRIIRIFSKPFFIGLGIIVSYFGTISITEGDKQYDIEKLGERTKINQEYLSEFVETGSAYHIGKLDGTLMSVLEVAPAAINVALFRPYLWEVRNPVMLLSAIEATIFMLLTAYLFFKTGFFKSPN